jgi:hypothetical protein
MTTILDIVEIRNQLQWMRACGLNYGRDAEDINTIIDVMEQIQSANMLMQNKPH